MTVEEIADYLKLLGFGIEQRSDRSDKAVYVSTPITHVYSDRIAEMWNGIGIVGLFTYGNCTLLLKTLSKSYKVTKCMEYYYAISRRSS